MRALAAGEDAHGGGPAVELVGGRAFAQQPGQLGDVGFLHPAGAVRAPVVSAGVIGAAFAGLAAVIDRSGNPGRTLASPRGLLKVAGTTILTPGVFQPAATSWRPR